MIVFGIYISLLAALALLLSVLCLIACIAVLSNKDYEINYELTGVILGTNSFAFLLLFLITIFNPLWYDLEDTCELRYGIENFNQKNVIYATKSIYGDAKTNEGYYNYATRVIYVLRNLPYKEKIKIIKICQDKRFMQERKARIEKAKQSKALKEIAKDLK